MTTTFGAIAALLAFSTGAAAEEASSSKAQKAQVEHYSYEFEADFLDGDDLDGDGPIIKGRKRPPQVMLIRPRTSFVKELIVTAESL